MIKAVFFDIDGTLLDHSGEKSVFPASTAASLFAMRKKGIKLFVATGRAPSMLDMLDQYFPFDGFVTFNGQLVIDREGNVLHCMPHDPEDIRELVSIVHSRNLPAFVLEEKGAFPLTDLPDVRAHFQWMNVPFPPFYDPARLDKHPVLQASLYMPLEEAAPLLSHLHVEVTTSGGDILDVIPMGGGKEVGIAATASHYGFSRENIMVFGDGPNDARMLRWAGVGVAMGNGDPEAKSAADYVTTHVGKDGIKNALLHFGVLSALDFERG